MTPENDLAGHTIDELVDYYDAGLMPPDDSIDTSAGCQIALASIARLRQLTAQLVDDDAVEQPPVADGWVSGILGQISTQAQAGRDIPLYDSATGGGVVITEGAVRAIIRAAGDRIEGLFIGRCRFTGDVTQPGEPVQIDIDASMLWGQNISRTAAVVKQSIVDELRLHTRLTITGVNVTVHDVRRPTDAGEEVGS